MRTLIALLVFSLFAAHASAEVVLTDLKVDYEEVPMTLESENPLFSWRMESDDGAGQQTAYAIKVTSEQGALVWDSGRVSESESAGIKYQGAALEPTTLYNWEVKIWREDGGTASGASRFETGFMVPGDSSWPGATWIGGGARDLGLWSEYLTVFQLNYTVQLDEPSDSERAAFVFGGNDFRLMDRDYNIQGVENEEDESYVALELDVSGLADKGGKAKINVYRLGYSESDSFQEPLVSLAVPNELINKANQYQPHTIYVRSMFGLLNVQVNGKTTDHLITPYDENMPPHLPQGVNLNPVAFGGQLSPTGNPADYIAFPSLADLGFWLKPGQRAHFSQIEVRNYRAPSNLLFTAGTKEQDGYAEIFVDDDSGSSINQLATGGYSVMGGEEGFLILENPSRLSAPMLRTQFALESKPIEKARLYATARGIYELYVNGERIGDDYFAPGLTQYNKHHTYQAYDVTAQLQQGSENVVGAWLSEGWWSGNITYSGGNWNYFGDRQSLLAKLVITYEDGSTQEINSQPDSWSVFLEGPLVYGSFFQGEVYDARLESRIEGWSSAGYNAEQWQPASEVSLKGSATIVDKNLDPNSGELITGYEDMDLIGHAGDSPQIVDVLTAQSVEEVRPGVFLYDMGQNMVGFPRVELKNAERGDRIVLRHGEMRYPDLPESGDNVGMVMMENIRAALAHDTYFAKGGSEVIQPRFTFHGYRYVEITGIERALPLAAVQGMVVSSVSELTAGYETSNELVNKLWDNITWSMKSNFLSIPTDTPARNERMGWSGDINVFAKTATYMADVNAFLDRHLMAMRDIQRADGRFPDVAPVGGGFGGVLWGSAGIIVPWEVYLQYGDITLLEDHYAAMKRYMAYLETQRDKESGVQVGGNLGDWLSPVGTQNDNTLLWTAYHVYLLEVMSEVSELLSKPKDHQSYQGRYRELKQLFNETYVDAETGRTVRGGVEAGTFGAPAPEEGSESRKGELVDTQASYAIPLAMGVFDEQNATRAAQYLAEAVRRENLDDQGVKRPGYSLMTGFIGTAALTEALSEYGYAEVAYKLLQQTTYPSWLYSINNGATTIWERLNSYTREEGFGGNNSMNSFNHYSFGAVGAWMINHSLGIMRDQEYPGFKQFILQPTPDPTGEMTWARGHYDSMYGRIESEWIYKGDNTFYQFVVPSNSVAILSLAAGSRDSIRFVSDSGDYAVNPEYQGEKEGRQAYKLLPGKYQFTVRRE